jgi:CheY-like chemotaxis protein
VVADDGEGIDPDFLPHLFTRFRQAEAGNARQHGGLGLGLSIVSNLVRLHGGEVRVASAGRGTGTEVTVTLPLAPTLGVPGQAVSGDEPVSLNGVRLILVDDQADVREAVGRLLERLGAHVVALASGEGIEAVIARERPQLLLLDIGMPGEDGYTLIRRLRKLPASRGGSVPAISLTAHAREEDRAHALASGFQEHLAKPIDLPRLTAAIQRLAARPANEAEQPPAAGADAAELRRAP